MLNSWWQQIKKHPVATVLIALLAVVIMLVVLIILGYLFNWDWTGLNGYNQVTITRTLRSPNGGTVTRTEVYQPGKTLLDWLQLLLLPALFIVTAFFIFEFRVRNLNRQAAKPLTYDQKIKQLTNSLNKASIDATQILEEMAKIIQDRQNAVTILEQKQTELQKYIDSLEIGPAETLKIYQEILEEQARNQDKESRRLARRYFIYGALITLLGTIIGILFTFVRF